MGVADEIITLNRLIDRLERVEGRDEQLNVDVFCEAFWDGQGDERMPPDMTGSIDAAASLLPSQAVWRRFTDLSASVYAASPYNAAAQIRHDGTNPRCFPAALTAAILRMKVAPMLKVSARSVDRSGEAGETPLGGSTEGESAVPNEDSADAQSISPSPPPEAP